MLLTPEETRVLGALVEKQLATPQHYPLSENALIAACNQSTNREPVTAYTQDEVRRALVGLREQGLAREARRPGERTPKHRHLLPDVLDVPEAGIAVLCVLMLRGPQTLGELRTRTERLHPFASIEEVQATLDSLADHPAGPLVEHLPRMPGQKEARWAQLLSAEQPVTAASAAAAPAGSEPAGPRVSLVQLAEEVARLRAEVDELRAHLGLPHPGEGPV
jgi:uncharacterized protein